MQIATTSLPAKTRQPAFTALFHQEIDALIIKLLNHKDKGSLRLVSKTSKAAVDGSITAVQHEAYSTRRTADINVLLNANWDLRKLVYYYSDGYAYSGGIATVNEWKLAPNLHQWRQLHQLALYSAPVEAIAVLAALEMPALRRLRFDLVDAQEQAAARLSQRITEAAWVPHLESLDILCEETVAAVQFILPKATNLQELSLHVEPEGLNELTKCHYPHLTELSLCFFGDHLLGNDSCNLPSHNNMPQLKVLKLENRPDTDADDVIVSLCKSEWQLFDLRLTDFDISHVDVAAITAAWSSTLTSLRFMVEEQGRNARFNDEAVAALKQGRWENLRELNLCTINNCSDQGMLGLAAIQFPVLTSLRLWSEGAMQGKISKLAAAPWMSQLHGLAVDCDDSLYHAPTWTEWAKLFQRGRFDRLTDLHFYATATYDNGALDGPLNREDHENLVQAYCNGTLHIAHYGYGKMSRLNNLWILGLSWVSLKFLKKQLRG